VWYCSAAHQKDAWSEHKGPCKKTKKERQQAESDAGSILAQLAAATPSREENSISLCISCVDGDENKVRQILLGGRVDINYAGLEGCTPAFLAAYEGHVNCLAVLAQHGADLSKEADNGWAPIHVACQKGRVDCMWPVCSGE
jgi:ankyrin repeat protein